MLPGRYDPAQFVVVDGRPTALRPLPATIDRTNVPADAATAVTIAALPAGAAIDVSGPVNHFVPTVDGATVELTFAEPGEYSIVVRAPSFAKAEFQIRVE